jgi:diketogulonate reductase-like aldo/keto reductase
MTLKSMEKATEKSLKCLDIPTMDMFLIHWPNPIIGTKKHIRFMESLVKAGKTRYIGVSNYGVSRFKASQQAVPDTPIVNNQIHINVVAQGNVGKALPYFQKEGVTVSAWSPLGHSGFKNLKQPLKSKLEKIAQAHDATIHQIAIAWVINLKGVFTIPKAFKPEHVEANAAAAEIQLTEAEMRELTQSKQIELTSFDA